MRRNRAERGCVYVCVHGCCSNKDTPRPACLHRVVVKWALTYLEQYGKIGSNKQDLAKTFNSCFILLIAEVMQLLYHTAQNLESQTCIDS